MATLICINSFIIFAQLSICLAVLHKATEREPKLMHFVRAGVERTISYLL